MKYLVFMLMMIAASSLVDVSMELDSRVLAWFVKISGLTMASTSGVVYTLWRG